MWYIYVMEFYSAVKRNEIMKLARKWAGLKFVILNEVTPTQEDSSVWSLSRADLNLICIYCGHELGYGSWNEKEDHKGEKRYRGGWGGQ